MRVKAIIAYDGSLFKGFQKQKSTKNTVTSAFETALYSLGIKDKICGSGRTDAGVHATGQTIDFLLPKFWSDLERLKEVLNQKLDGISVKYISFVSDDFHSRFSAKKRRYRYVFKTTTPSVFEKQYISHYPPFNESVLEDALKTFIGRHDFTNFMKTGTVTHTNIREIYSARYRRYRNYHIIYFEANGFLRSQVRMMVEGAMQVSLNRLSLVELKRQLNLEERIITKLAPPEGLYLAQIIY